MPSTDTGVVHARPRVRIDGQDRPSLGEASLALDLHLPRSGMASAELRVLNWGPAARGQPDFVFQDVRLGSRIEVLLGEAAAAPAFTGEVTGLEERYGDGAPHLVLLAEDALHRLARRRASRAFEDVALDDVVRRVASEAGLTADVSVSSASSSWLQHNESDLAFLLREVEAHDVGLRLQDGKLRARDEEPDPSPVRLSPGDRADRVRIVADLAHQPREVAVTGWDLASDGATRGHSASLAPAPQGTTAASALSGLGWEGRSSFPHPAARTQGEADALAARRFRRSAQRFLHGEIVCRDTPDLRSGREIELSGVSPRLAGRYRVEDCRHLFDAAAGLRTRVRVQRADWNP